MSAWLDDAKSKATDGLSARLPDSKIQMMLVSDFDYHLPEHLIAQEPARQRDRSRLLVLDRASGEFQDSTFDHLPDFLRAGDALVINNTRVFPARLIGRRVRMTEQGEAIEGARVEVFLVRQIEPLVWETLARPGRALPAGARLAFADELKAEVIERLEAGRRIIRFYAHGDFDEIIDRTGRTPLPPYIKRNEDARLDRERYQTVFARERGAIAAPTAGLHFTPALLDRIRQRGIETIEITLHVGYGTFQPVRVDRVEDHRVESERYTITEDAARSINRAIKESRRIIAVGTTTTRALESATRPPEEKEYGSKGVWEYGRNEFSSRTPTLPHSHTPTLRAITSSTDLFIYPGFEFRAISGLVTNFHLPRSSLLMLAAAFAGRESILRAYRHAVEQEYRFYSYGDAMLIL
ncbi:MAG: tRNA preQ1(34) S-adenosylmethionine ribosyltransferase-isomerase QueA [Acidobacteriota bacterium]